MNETIEKYARIKHLKNLIAGYKWQIMEHEATIAPYEKELEKLEKEVQE